MTDTSSLQKFAVDLASPYWWISVVCVGLLINIASAYLKSPIDRFFARLSLRRRAKSERRAEDLEYKSTQLAGNLQLFNIEVSLQIRDFVLAVWLLTLATTLAVILWALAPYHLSASPLKFLFSIVLAIVILGLYFLSNLVSQRAINSLEFLALARSKQRQNSGA